MQAISVIVTHRTDDMRKLPPILAEAAAGIKRTDDAPSARPRLAMRGALGKGGLIVPVGGPVPVDTSVIEPLAGPPLAAMAVGTAAVQLDEGVSSSQRFNHVHNQRRSAGS